MITQKNSGAAATAPQNPKGANPMNESSVTPHSENAQDDGRLVSEKIKGVMWALANLSRSDLDDDAYTILFRARKDLADAAQQARHLENAMMIYPALHAANTGGAA
jgi:hypothetical protein